MTRICKVEIQNFRSIRSLTWFPSPGLNCLIGPGDSGKSTILDAIDLCLGARRTVSFGDTDFTGLDVTQPIQIVLTLGSLPDALKDLDTYGNYLQGFNPQTGELEEEPRQGLESVLVLRLLVGSDLEPAWTLISQRAQALGHERNIAWKDRLLLAPARLGVYANSNLSWTRGSVLNRLSEERPDLGAELANAARDARASFGNRAGAQLAETIQTVAQKAGELGVPVGAGVQALLDAHSVSIGDGAIALHNEQGSRCARWVRGLPACLWRGFSEWPRSVPPSRWSMKWSTGLSHTAWSGCSTPSAPRRIRPYCNVSSRPTRL